MRDAALKSPGAARDDRHAADVPLRPGSAFTDPLGASDPASTRRRIRRAHALIYGAAAPSLLVALLADGGPASQRLATGTAMVVTADAAGRGRPYTVSAGVRRAHATEARLPARAPSGRLARVTPNSARRLHDAPGGR